MTEFKKITKFDNREGYRVQLSGDGLITITVGIGTVCKDVAGIQNFQTLGKEIVSDIIAPENKIKDMFDAALKCVMKRGSAIHFTENNSGNVGLSNWAYKFNTGNNGLSTEVTEHWDDVRNKLHINNARYRLLGELKRIPIGDKYLESKSIDELNAICDDFKKQYCPYDQAVTETTRIIFGVSGIRPLRSSWLSHIITNVYIDTVDGKFKLYCDIAIPKNEEGISLLNTLRDTKVSFSFMEHDRLNPKIGRAHV
jgi:hypothetical protein